MGKAGRARTHSRPETRALKSELRRCQTGRARGAGGSGRHHGSGRRRGGARLAPPPPAATGLHLQGLGLDENENPPRMRSLAQLGLMSSTEHLAEGNGNWLHWSCPPQTIYKVLPSCTNVLQFLF